MPARHAPGLRGSSGGARRATRTAKTASAITPAKEISRTGLSRRPLVADAASIPQQATAIRYSLARMTSRVDSRWTLGRMLLRRPAFRSVMPSFYTAVLCRRSMSTRDTDRFETKAIHAGQQPDPTTGAVMTPVYLTSTYAQSGPGEHKGFEYSRTRNPTRDALQGCLAALESGKHALAFASGLAATDAVLHLLSSGDHVVLSDDLYGGTFRLADKVFKRLGIEQSYVDVTDPKAVEAAFRPNTRLLWVETPTNPMLKICDLAALAEVSRKRGAISVCDNTFATPFFQRPLEFGFDVVAHSMTKYLNGHSDVVAGALVLRRDDLHEKLAFLQNAVGAVPGPLDSFLVLRGLKTLHVRMERHE